MATAFRRKGHGGQNGVSSGDHLPPPQCMKGRDLWDPVLSSCRTDSRQAAESLRDVLEEQDQRGSVVLYDFERPFPSVRIATDDEGFGMTDGSR